MEESNSFSNLNLTVKTGKNI